MVKPLSDAMMLGAPISAAGRPCLELSESRNRLGGARLAVRLVVGSFCARWSVRRFVASLPPNELIRSGAFGTWRALLTHTHWRQENAPALLLLPRTRHAARGRSVRLHHAAARL